MVDPAAGRYLSQAKAKSQFSNPEREENYSFTNSKPLFASSAQIQNLQRSKRPSVQSDSNPAANIDILLSNFAGIMPAEVGELGAQARQLPPSEAQKALQSSFF